MIRGIDVSSHQGQIDWVAIAHDAQAIKMASTKLTGGDYYVNPTAQPNATGMHGMGLYRDFYHYAFEGEWPGSGAKAEANWFLMNLPDLNDTDTVSLDLEEGQGPLTEWALEWLEHVRDSVGFTPCLYSSKGFLDAHFMTGDPRLAEYPLWLASWGQTQPPTPEPWTVTAFWQYSANGKVDGVSGTVDMDYFNGTEEQRKLYGRQPLPATPKPPAKDTFSVGSGIREMMAEDATTPLTSSVWLTGVVSETEWAFGRNDVQYFWHVPSGHHWRVRPS